MSKPCMYTPGIGAPSLGSTFLHHGPLALPVAMHTYTSTAKPDSMDTVSEQMQEMIGPDENNSVWAETRECSDHNGIVICSCR